jgi:long-chain fatty acid transport protein
MKSNCSIKIAVAMACCAPALAFATDGYFSHGYGMKAKGMAGAATATASDAFGGANNPASMVWAGSRLDIGLDLFSPRRDISRTGSSGNGTGMDGSVDSGSNIFAIPEFGYNRMLGQDMAVGVTVYGNGGMNTDFNGGQIAGGNVNACGSQGNGGPGSGFNFPSGQAGPYNLLCGAGKLGVNLEQLMIAPTFAMKANERHSFGASLQIVYQKFKAQGLSSFYGYTTPAANGVPYSSGNNLTDRGNDTSWGYGLKLGWMGKVSDTVSLGASYTSKMKMDKFDKYKDLFAGQGYFDIPESINLGIAVKATPQVTVAADYQRINYSGIRSIANPSRTPGDGLPPYGGVPNSLGCDTCRGFGWQSVNVLKLGVEYQYNPNLVLRAGYNHTDNPIASTDVTFNMLAPGVIKDHLTLGFTYNVSKESEVTMAYMHGFKNSVSGPSLFNSWLGDNATDKIQMYQNSLGIAYSRKFE